MNCTTCNEVIKRPPSLSKAKNLFCNHDCYSKFKAIKWENNNNPRWKGGDDKLNCIVCKKEYTRKKYGKKINKYCSLECAAKERGLNARGNKHWNWKGGKDTRYMRKFAPRPIPANCEVCNSLGSSFKKGLHYDHDHATGKFRGWLCTNCNSALGLVKDNKETLKSLIHYIEINENRL